MEEDLPYGSDSGISLFGKIRERLGGIPPVLAAIFATLVAGLSITALYILLSPDISFKDLLNKIRITEEKDGEKNISVPFKPTPKPLATGRQVYLISGSKEGAPKPSEFIIDPIDPKEGATQKVEAKVLSINQSPVTQVEVTMITDNKRQTYPLKLTSGTNLDGVWQGSWSLNDSYLYLYQASVKVKNASTDWDVTLTFR